jgi:hypothetical protein
MKRVRYGHASSPEMAKFFASMLDRAFSEWAPVSAKKFINLIPKGNTMSYSFQFSAADKSAARIRAAQEFQLVADMQPVHAQDRGPALSALDAYLDLLADDDTRDIQVTVNGSVSYAYEQGMDQKLVPLTHASVSVSAYLTPKLSAE